ncbi:MAG: translation initiation factor IF-3 [Candidatus Sumerlaeia bacterium]|nr:translation initiation factor IF-3 [Candidatus Sumerlaeia bacterium]
MRAISKRAFLRINEAIRAREVRLINADGKQIGVVPIEQARRYAEEAGQDLVEVAPEATPPVCKIVDYRKVLYEQKRREREGRKHRRHTEVKEIKMRPTIDPHDYEIKMRHTREFLQAGHKVKVTIMYRGREMVRTDIGRQLLQRMADDVADLGVPEDRMVQIGRQQQMMLAPGGHGKSAEKHDRAAMSAASAAPQPPVGSQPQGETDSRPL